MARLSIERVARTIRTCLEKHVEVKFSYLYGSSTRGDLFNDVDVAIMLDERFQPAVLYPESIAGEIEDDLVNELGLRVPADVRVLNTARDVRFLNALLDGAFLLFSKDEPARVRFESRVTMQYLDMLPFLQLHDPAKVQDRGQTSARCHPTSPGGCRGVRS